MTSDNRNTSGVSPKNLPAVFPLVFFSLGSRRFFFALLFFG